MTNNTPKQPKEVLSLGRKNYPYISMICDVVALIGICCSLKPEKLLPVASPHRWTVLVFGCTGDSWELQSESQYDKRVSYYYWDLIYILSVVFAPSLKS